MEDKQYAALVSAMIAHDAGSPKRIQHLLKVHAFARTIGILEGLDEETLYILETAALLHDIGIREALAQYGSEAGPYQERLGPPLAEAMLRKIGGYSEEQIARISYLIGHHHTYTEIDGIDYQILVEADLLVNLYEHNSKYKAIYNADRKLFKTQAGRQILEQMYAGEAGTLIHD